MKISSEKIIRSERERTVLWVPVLFMLGVLFYFSLEIEPVSGLSAAALFLLSIFMVTASVSGRHRWLKYFIFALLIVVSGFAAAEFRTWSVKSPSLKEKIGPIYLHADVVNIEPLSSGYRLMLKNNDIYKFPYHLTPKLIRINAHTDISDVMPGDRIGVRVMLSPPPRPVYPGSYDFSFYSYFKQIGAVGYSISDVRILKKDKDFSEYINKLRFSMAERIKYFLYDKDDEGSRAVTAIAAALLIGIQTGIPAKTFQAMRDAGLSHILSISGLHMAIVMASCFFILRAILAAIPYIALRHNIKKWAAFISIWAGLLYLIIAGSPVPAVRSYIMAGLFFISIIVDRTGTFMRPVMIAAFLILLLEPEVAMNAGFQMSFSAVIALITVFEVSEILKSELISERGIITRVLLYLFSISVASLVAGLATAPFVIYHFGNFQVYGLLANLIVVPITSFWIMPSGMIALLLMPFGLEAIGLLPMEWGLRLIIYIAEKVSSLPFSTIPLPSFSGWAILLIALGGLWLCFWKTHIRQFGIFLIIIGISTLAFHKAPDIIIDGKGKLFAVKNEEGELYFSSRVHARFARTSWQRHNGQKNADKLNDFSDSDNVSLSCNDNECLYKNYKSSALIILHNALSPSCRNADVVINLAKQFKCSGRHATITTASLSASGTHTISFDREEINIETVAGRTGRREWNQQENYPEEDEEIF